MGGANFVTIGAIPDPSNDGVSAASVSLATTGVIIAASAGKRISVHGLFLTVTTAAGTIQFQDINAGTSTVNLTGAITMGAGIPLVLPWQNYPWLLCATGDNLTLALGTAGQVSGRIFYMQG